MVDPAAGTVERLFVLSTYSELSEAERAEAIGIARRLRGRRFD
jgi:hypothetical protein